MFGLPMIRPLSWPHAATVPAYCLGSPSTQVESWEGRLEDSAMFVGDYFYVVPVTRAGTQKEDAWGLLDTPVHLPSGPDLWYDFATGVAYSAGVEMSYSTDIESIPVFVRGGSIVPTKERQRRSSDAMFLDPFTLHIYPSSSGTACGSLYVDDTLSYDYLKGTFVYSALCYRQGKLSSSPLRAMHKPAQQGNQAHGWEQEGRNQLPEGAGIVERIVVWGLTSPPTAVHRVSKDQAQRQLSFTATALRADAGGSQLPTASSMLPGPSPYFYEGRVDVTYRVDVKKPGVAVGEYDWQIVFDLPNNTPAETQVAQEE
eukprot:GHVS01072603.1.p1 GENE.GHVS01072603.1~~GHVS01072603.1.p1  ORF type:complete len:314 (+),score=42.63 GHVS01072603.1:331-1272(+)